MSVCGFISGYDTCYPGQINIDYHNGLQVIKYSMTVLNVSDVENVENGDVDSDSGIIKGHGIIVMPGPTSYYLSELYPNPFN